jgi:hypothetical protein
LLLGCAVAAHPHDALFKAAFQTPANAAALLRELLPTAIRDAIAWDTIQGEPASYIDTALADSHSDLLFSARLRTGLPASVLLLLEHQSTVDPEMLFRGMSYDVQIWKRFARTSLRCGYRRSSQLSSATPRKAGRCRARSATCSIRRRWRFTEWQHSFRGSR